MTLNEFTRSVDPGSLPRILQIQSGIYVQGRPMTNRTHLEKCMLMGLRYNYIFDDLRGFVFTQFMLFLVKFTVN